MYVKLWLDLLIHDLLVTFSFALFFLFLNSSSSYALYNLSPFFPLLPSHLTSASIFLFFLIFLDAGSLPYDCLSAFWIFFLEMPIILMACFFDTNFPLTLIFLSACLFFF